MSGQASEMKHDEEEARREVDTLATKVKMLASRASEHPTVLIFTRYQVIVMIIILTMVLFLMLILVATVVEIIWSSCIFLWFVTSIIWISLSFLTILLLFLVFCPDVMPLALFTPAR